MSKKIMVSASLLAKSQVAAYTRSDGVTVQAHDNGRQAAAPEPINHKVLAKLKTTHKADAHGLKSSLASSLSSGDTEGHDGSPMTYGDLKGHMQTMHAQLGSKPEHAEHLKHAQFALNQSFGLNHKPVSEKHAKLIGAALSGKTKIDDDGVVQHAPAAKKPAAPKPAAGGYVPPKPGDVGHDEHTKYGAYFRKGDKVKDGSGKVHEVMSHRGAEVQTYNGGSFHPTKLSHADAPAAGAKKVGVRASVAKQGAPAAPAPPDWKSAHEEAEGELATASYRGGSKEKAVAALKKAADLHRAAAKRQAPGDMSPEHHSHYADKLSALAKDHGGGEEKTGSAAPAKTKNVGTEKWPLHAKSSEKLAAKRDDGSTHHVGGFEPPSSGKGDHLVHHDGKAFSFTGKSGKNMKTGEASYEYSHKDDAKGIESRAWVTHSGHLVDD